MKIAVVGGAGRQALGAVYDFAEDESVEKLLLIDALPEALEARVKLVHAEKVESKVIDVLDTEKLAAALNDYDAVINCSTHKLNMPVMDACIASRTNYTDLGGLYHWAKEQLTRHEDFKNAGITGIVGSGVAPGMVNVMAKYAADRLDSVETVRIYSGIVNRLVKGNQIVPQYAMDTIIDEFTINNFEFRDGEILELPAFSGEEMIDFAEPVGRQMVYNVVHSEVATIPLAFAHKGIKNVSFRLALPKLFEEKLRFLLDNGFGSTDPIMIKGHPVAPRDLLIAMVEKPVQYLDRSVPQTHDDHKDIRVIVVGEKDGRRLTYQVETLLHPYPKWNMACGPFTVGYPGAVTTRLLGAGKIKEKGFFSGESVIDPQMYFDELAKRGIKFFVQVTHDLN
ncbi:saccharopine dehydrogenase family protein [Desulfosarcina ovata]|uniref:Saccharopine dehydrogenase n=2 Tax=Desulfosarcina ovata TaxID=83564 RepID=A0A5K8AHF1_9BACT|nr:saccharopine dehydrogenase NADP-binding domain-containing protein [Desulfosarcina ovata]BBO85218.1 saccharopine dehydrogenase [Desulfosarcina ovata subsp. sediminis]BBO92112.1 saccharopine dehydrogenase [Desulfosarcina ovata subsp. ovata]